VQILLYKGQRYPSFTGAVHINRYTRQFVGQCPRYANLTICHQGDYQSLQYLGRHVFQQVNERLQQRHLPQSP